MLKLKWTSLTITTNQEANDMLKFVYELKPTIGAFDTETTGLHIVNDRPFVFQFGFIHPNMKEGYSYAVDLERQPLLANAVITAWHKYAKVLEKYAAHNVKFDLHMLENIEQPYAEENLTDTMFYIRHAHDALSPALGGPPLKLKEYTTRYIDASAKTFQHELAKERTGIAKDLNLKLKNRLKECGLPPEEYKAKSYTLAVIEDLFKDPIVGAEDLPENIRDAYLTWLNNDVPDNIRPKITGLMESDFVPYNTLNRSNLLKYAHYDIIYTLEVLLSLMPIVEVRKTMAGIDVEERLILPLYEMERIGFNINKEYLEESRIALKSYILQQRQKLYTLASRPFRIGQHELIKNLFEDLFQIKIISTNADELDKLHSDLIIEQANPEAITFIELLQELRTLEKWYSTYIMRFKTNLVNCDRLYTTINQVGTVSGRVASDFQQFPKEAITTTDGQELFHPRKMIKPTGGEYDAIIYLDYSQIELRFQALYTILVGSPDTNLCRAYMPYKCFDSLGLGYNFNNPDHHRRNNEVWFLEESPASVWHPVDVHAATTKEATGINESDPQFKSLRTSIGKKVNFAKNYGAKYKKIRQMFPDKTEEEVKKIDNAYYKAFPGVMNYHYYCYERAREFSFTTNLFGIRYYNVSGHKLINMLVQGSSAYFLKEKIIELYNYCKKNNIKSRFQMNVHDEMSWERHNSETEVFFEFQKIMEDWKDTKIPIIAEMEATTVSWGDKKGVKNLDELRTYLES